MKILLLLLVLISCEEQPSTTSNEGDITPRENVSERVQLGKVYNLNGTDYDLIVESDYDSYVQVFSLVTPTYKETIRMKYRLRVDSESISDNKITRYHDNGELRNGKTSEATIYATNEYIDICRKKNLADDEIVCDTFEVVE